jgi:hypothetical protein
MKKLSEITDWHQLINEVVCGDCGEERLRQQNLF